MKQCEGDFVLTSLSANVVIVGSETAALLPAAQVIQAALDRHVGSGWEIKMAVDADSAQGHIVLCLDPNLRSEQYQLSVRKTGVRIVGRDGQAVYRGAMTIVQLLRQSPRVLPALEIDDWPDFPVRGVMLDISRDKVPTMQTLYALVDQLAEWKINQLQLYTEHTFAYRAHKDVWEHASPMTGPEIRSLDEYCRSHFIDLVPNQNSFGHLERWLRKPRYRALAEAENGSELPWGGRWEGPAGLCPGEPGSIEFLREMYDELLPHFSSRLFNVGCDETWDLGQGKSKSECELRGKGQVYLEFLLKIHKLVQERGRTMQFWNDIILHHPELIPELPKNIIALQWGYNANHPFDRDGKHFGDAGIPYYVCPGTSTWQAFVARTDNALSNLATAARSGLTHGAIGYLNTDWGDFGHLQYQPASYLGWAAGAAFSWCYQTNAQLPLTELLDTHVFRDRAKIMGKLVYELGNVYKHAPKILHGATQLFRILVPVPSEPINPTQGMTREHLDDSQSEIERIMESLHRARMDLPDGQLIMDEFRNSAAMMLHACRLGRYHLDPSTENETDLAADLRNIIAEHQRLWRMRNRIGGLSDSTAHLSKVLAGYATSFTMTN
jgi:hexosaminidase